MDSDSQSCVRKPGVQGMKPEPGALRRESRARSRKKKKCLSTLMMPAQSSLHVNMTHVSASIHREAPTGARPQWEAPPSHVVPLKVSPFLDERASAEVHPPPLFFFFFFPCEAVLIESSHPRHASTAATLCARRRLSLGCVRELPHKRESSRDTVNGAQLLKQKIVPGTLI